MSKFCSSTQRFILRTLTEHDATPEYLSWLNSNAEFIMEKPQKINQLKAYINQFNDKKEVYFLAIIDKQSDKHIGNVKFIFKQKAYSEVEMGILIGNENYRGKGVAGEVIKRFAHYALTKYQCKTMTLGVHIDNSPAIKAYKKLGFIIAKVQAKDSNSSESHTMKWDLTELGKN